MLGRLAVLSAAIALTACAGVESAGRTARAQSATASAPRAAPVSTPALTPPPAQTAPVATAPLPPPPPQQNVAAATPRVTTPPPAASPPPVQARVEPPPAAPAATTETGARQPLQTRRAADDNVVVRGQTERQVEAPSGDPRSTAERMQDVNAWDRCVTRVQAAYESDPMRPQLDSPEEYCRQSLGMRNRDAVPESRRQRPR